MPTLTKYFPDESVEFGFTMGLNFGVRVVRFANGRRQATQTIERALRSLEARIPTITLAKSESIRDFVTKRFGPLELFYIWGPPFQQFTAYGQTWLVGDGARAAFVLPFKGGATITNVKFNGILKTLTTHYTLDDAGPGGERRIVATAGNEPGVGHLVTFDVVGRERIPVELTDIRTPIEHPLRRPQSSTASGAADYYGISVLEVPITETP